MRSGRPEDFVAKLNDYAEWASITEDLVQAAVVLRNVQLVPENGDQHLRRALWEGALVAYFRCFLKGSRSARLGELLSGLTQHQRDTHIKAKDWRNRHAAHRDSAHYQEGRVRIEVDPSGKIISVELNLSVSTSPKDPHWRELADVADALRERVIKGKLEPLLNEVAAAWPAMQAELELVETTGAGDVFRLVPPEDLTATRGAPTPDRDDT